VQVPRWAGTGGGSRGPEPGSLAKFGSPGPGEEAGAFAVTTRSLGRLSPARRTDHL